MGSSTGKVDLESITVEQVEQFHKWLTGEQNTEEIRCKTQPHLTVEEAFSAIYYLQEVLGVLPDNYEMCRECGRIFDSYEEGTHIDADTEGYTEEACGNYCEDCVPIPDYEAKG